MGARAETNMYRGPGRDRSTDSMPILWRPNLLTIKLESGGFSVRKFRTNEDIPEVDIYASGWLRAEVDPHKMQLFTEARSQGTKWEWMAKMT